jgi:hypothetical protein
MKSKTFIVGFLAIVAVLAGASLYFSAMVDRADKKTTSFVAPDGKFKAVKITVASGGASPFCFDSVSVLLAVYPDEFALREKAYEIYAAPCASFASREPSPKIEWLSGTGLQITAVPSAKARSKNIDVTKSVHVTVLERDRAAATSNRR